MFLNKMTLASLVLLIALGLVFVATPAMAATFAANATVPDQVWKKGQANISLTLPKATAEEDGTMSATLAYGGSTYRPGDTLGGPLTGLTFAFSTTTGVGRLTGANAHNVKTTLTLVTYTVTETDGNGDGNAPADAVLRAFGVTITDADPLRFPTGTTITDKVLIVGNAFSEVLPAAVGGVGPLTYTATGTLAPGMNFSATSRLLAGIPTRADQRRVITYGVTDSDTDAGGNAAPKSVVLSFTITVRPRPTGPIFTITKVPDAEYTKGHAITAMTLPAANTTYATAPVTYTLTGLPKGLSFDGATRTLTGTPNPTTPNPTDTSVSDAIYTATDATGATNAASVRFKITVNPAVSVTVPDDFPRTGSYLRGQRFADITVLNATGGTGTPADYTYAVTGLPAGLTFANMKITGTPTAAGVSTVTITATDTLGATGSDDFTITVSAASNLGFDKVIVPQTYKVGEAITPMLLPAGTGGISPYTYAFDSRPAGISFDSKTRLLSGTPTTAQAATTHNYVISDSAFSHVKTPTDDQVPNTVTLPITITVTGTGGTANNAPDFGNATIPNINATAGVAIVGRFLPKATDADKGDTLTYSIVETLPAGLNFSPTTRALTGTPTTPMAQAPYTYKVEDGNGGSDTIGFFITVGGTAPPPPTSVYMYWTDLGARKIQRATLNGTNVTDHIVGLPSPYGIALNVTGGHIYWTAQFAGSIQRANLDGSNPQTLLTGLSGPIGLAVDVTGGHIYWTAQLAGSIQRANLDGSNPQTLLTGLSGPVGLAVDVTGGKMYWTTATGSIQRANLNGANLQTLIPTGSGLISPQGLALDVSGGKMYWTDHSAGSIQRANLNGTNRETLVTTGNPAGLALDVAAQKVYWVSQNPGSIQRANLNGTNRETLVTGLTSPYGIALGISVTGPGPVDPDPLDVDGNGQVTVIDLAIVALLYGTRVQGVPNFPADVNSDGVVNLLDLTLVAQGIDAAGGNLGKLAGPAMEAAWAAAAEQAAALEAVAGSPNALSSGNRPVHNVAAALSDAKQLATSDTRLENDVPVVLETLLALLTETKVIPETTALLPNYPNPFNPETWIPYHLAQDAKVTVTIYDVRGEVVRTLTLGQQPAGVYETRHRAAYWDGRNQHGETVASGVYFYTLTAGEFNATRKLLITK